MCFLQAENEMTGRAYMGEYDKSLTDIHYEMSELFDKQSECIKREFEENSGVHASSRKSVQ